MTQTNPGNKRGVGLCLGRKVEERVFIFLPDGRPVVIKVLELEPHKVRLGFDAPQDVTILREELV